MVGVPCPFTVDQITNASIPGVAQLLLLTAGFGVYRSALGIAALPPSRNSNLDCAERQSRIVVLIHEVDAIYDHGVLQPLGPLALVDGTRVHLRVEDGNDAEKQPAPLARILSPRLAHPEQAADFNMEVREATDASL